MILKYLFAQEEESIPIELRGTPEYRELQRLKQLRKAKTQDAAQSSSQTEHVGFKVGFILLM